MKLQSTSNMQPYKIRLVWQMELEEARRGQSSRASSPSDNDGGDSHRSFPAIRTTASPLQSLDLAAISSPAASSSGYIKARRQQPYLLKSPFQLAAVCDRIQGRALHIIQ